ncbi:ABC transporter substrate-binding protein [Myxococcota bacterium]|nr:ABC transporter substrate-binding protein [Myxococcota bacterium]MBU1536474.1 ABC transporter substrate-binding protein [Myxococcota bacterium]
MKYFVPFLFVTLCFPLYVRGACPEKDAASSKCAVSINHPLGAIKKFRAYVSSHVKKGMNEKAVASFGTTMEQYFHFDLMAQGAMHKHWSTLTADQQKEFRTLFSRMLKKSYLKKLVKHEKFKVITKGQKIKGDKARVQTMLIKIGGSDEDNIDVVYKMVKVGKSWKVYDVLTDEVSLVRNYRSTYAGLMKKGGTSSLFAHLKSVIQKP